MEDLVDPGRLARHPPGMRPANAGRGADFVGRMPDAPPNFNNKPLIIVDPGRLELPASCVQSRRSTG